jgi:hypothetical protein
MFYEPASSSRPSKRDASFRILLSGHDCSSSPSSTTLSRVRLQFNETSHQELVPRWLSIVPFLHTISTISFHVWCLNLNERATYFSSVKAKLVLAPLVIPEWVWPSTNRRRMFFSQTTTPPSSMPSELAKHWKRCKQNNQLLTKSHLEAEDNSVTLPCCHKGHKQSKAPPSMCVNPMGVTIAMSQGTWWAVSRRNPGSPKRQTEFHKTEGSRVNYPRPLERGAQLHGTFDLSHMVWKAEGGRRV